jgi:hypothetical protein
MNLFRKIKILTVDPKYDPTTNGVTIYSVSKSKLSKDNNKFKLEQPEHVALIMSDNSNLKNITSLIDTNRKSQLNEIIGTDDFTTNSALDLNLNDVIKGGSSIKPPHSTTRIKNHKRANITHKNNQIIRKKRNTTRRH